jgi:glycosyltransferase involved in cell wall biosynthesis
MPAVLLSHPHAAAVSCGLATSLARADRLAMFVTGVAFREESWTGQLAERLAASKPVVRNRILHGVPPGKLRALSAVELGARAAGLGLARFGGLPLKAYDAIFALHDAAVSRISWPRETSMVYAYEDGALWTFQRAARLGLERVWDLPTPHYLTVQDIDAREVQRWPGASGMPPHSEPEWKRRRKDHELRAATTISVASSFTKRSVERAGATAGVAVIPYGFPVDAFAARTAPPRGPFQVLAVGAHTLRKGTPYLLEAWKRAAIPEAQLTLIGPLRLSKAFVDGYAGSFRHIPHVPRAELGAYYAAADVLVFPTLGDGFGLVIQEAMCSGTPVVTTPSSGGPECIEHGVDGWVDPAGDLDALVARLRECAANRDRLFAMGRAARAHAERWTWADAEQALLRALAL